MKRFNYLIVQWPKLTLLLGLLLTSFFAYYASHLRINSSVENLYGQDDPNKKYYDEILALFGSDDMAVIGLGTENVYTSATLEKIKRITAEADQVDGVEKGHSLTNVPDPMADFNDPRPLIPRIPTDAAGLEALRRKAEGIPI